MKKGLLTVLLASLVLVGCQNYDDQFDDLNAQISALKSQVDGLSSLSGQVSSLSGSISGLSAGVAAAQAAATAAGASADAATAAANGIDLTGLSASLATLQAEVDAVQASLATAATATAVAALQAELDAIEADVDELLATSNVYNKDLAISSAAGLDAAVALGNNINIVNGTVTISQTTAMDATKLQSVIDKIFTVTGNYTYSAAATSVTPMTFDNLASVADLTLTVNGPVSAKALISAGTINLVSTYTSKVTGVDLGALTTVTNLETGGTDDTISFASATNVDLGSLANYPGVGSDYGLTILTKKGATLDIASLDDVSATGTATDVALSITGPKEVNISKIKSYSGSLTLKNIETATVSDFAGLISIDDGVENINISNAQQFRFLNGANDLETVVLDVDKLDDPDASATIKAYGGYGKLVTGYTGTTPGLSFASMSDLTSVTLTGFYGNLSFDTLSDLTTIDIEATFNDLTVSENDNLTSFDVTGSTFNDVTSFDGNDAITSLTLDQTTGLAFNGSTSSDDRALISVTGNAELTSLIIGANKIRNLTVTGNAKLASIDAAAWTSLGAEQSTTDYPAIAVHGNNMTATKAQDTDDGTTQYSVDGTNDASDKGTYTTSSKMETFAAALALIKADADSDANVHFDTVSIHTIDTDGVYGSEDAGEQNSGNALTFATNGGADTNWVGAVYVNEKSSLLTTNATAYDAVAWQVAYMFDATQDMTVDIDFENGSTDLAILHTGSAYGSVDLTGNTAIDVAALKTSLAVSRAATLGLTLDVAASGEASAPAIVFQSGVASSNGGNGENYTNTTAATALAANASYTAYAPALLTTYDKFTLTLGDASVTVTLTTDDLGGNWLEGPTAVATLAKTLGIAWDSKYSTGAASANYSIWTYGTTWSAGASMSILAPSLKASTSGSRGNGDVMAITWNTKSSSSQVSAASGGLATNSVMDWVIGTTEATTDNAATGTSIIVTLADATAGTRKTGAVSLYYQDQLVDNLVGAGTASTEAASGLLSTNLVSYGTAAQATEATGTGIYPTEAREDVVWGQASFEGVSSTTGSDRVTFSRIHWLSS